MCLSTKYRNGKYIVICIHLINSECELNLYGGRPSAGVCDLCIYKSDIPRTPVEMDRIRKSVPKPQSIGLGDTITKLIKFFSLGSIKQCKPCKKRQAKLNDKFPYKQTKMR